MTEEETSTVQHSDDLRVDVAGDHERGLLGSILVEPDCLTDLAGEGLRAEWFEDPLRRAIFEAARTLYTETGEVPLEAIDGRVPEDFQGVALAITAACGGVSSGTGARYYAERVREVYVRRKVRAVGVALAEYQEDVQAAIAQAQQGLLELTTARGGRGPERLCDLAAEWVAQLDDPNPAPDRTLATGILAFDRYVGGLRPGQFVLIAARPRVGKSTLLQNMAANIAVNHPVALYTFETRAYTIVGQLAARRAGVNHHRVLQWREMKGHEREALRAGFSSLMDLDITFDEGASKVGRFCAQTRVDVARRGTRAVFVDYLQLMEGPGRAETRRVEMGSISRRIKLLARELNIPVVAACQLNRASESREDRKPHLSDLRETGDLEQDADVVVLLHRPELYGERGLEHVCEVIVEKNRMGEMGTFELYYEPALYRFADLDTRERNA